MQSNEIRLRFLKFFEKRGHKIIPSASLVPLNDPTTLFTGSGMQPMVPYLLGQPHPLGNRITDSQKCFRAVDIDEVGDNRHTTFFEMLGNWSLGDYFKTEQIEWMFEFLVEEIGIDPKKLYITAFIGDEKNNIPKDTEAGEIWKKLFTKKRISAKEVEIGSEENGYKVGMQGGRIFFYDVKKNWWSRAGVPDNMPAGEPGGPDSEMFYEFTEVEHDTKFGEYCHPNCDCGRFLEIGNNVFMEYKKNEDGTFSKLPQKNIDFGGGLERLTMAVNNCPDIFEVNNKPILDYLEKTSGKNYVNNNEYTKSFRVITDHIKASIFLIVDGVHPSNTGRGYILRRLIRRVLTKGFMMELPDHFWIELVEIFLKIYKEIYPEIEEKHSHIISIVKEEEKLFEKPLNGIEIYSLDLEAAKLGAIKKSGIISILKDKNTASGLYIYKLFETFGNPIDLSIDVAKKLGFQVDEDEIKKAIEEHQELSRTASVGMFKGGLANHNEKTIKLHTAHHLLLAGLQAVVGKDVKQRGSNITEERLRIDFLCDHKLTDEEKKKVEDWVNDKIQKGLSVTRRELPLHLAEKIGAEMEFGAKYPDMVSVYFIGPVGSQYDAISKELCGGPHVSNTSELASIRDPEGSPKGNFKIQKEEAVAKGIRRIKAILL